MRTRDLLFSRDFYLVAVSEPITKSIFHLSLIQNPQDIPSGQVTLPFNTPLSPPPLPNSDIFKVGIKRRGWSPGGVWGWNPTTNPANLHSHRSVAWFSICLREYVRCMFFTPTPPARADAGSAGASARSVTSEELQRSWRQYPIPKGTITSYRGEKKTIAHPSN